MGTQLQRNRIQNPVLVIECRFKSGSRYQIFRSAFDERFRKLQLILPLADDLVLGAISRVRRLGSVMAKSAGLGLSIVRLWGGGRGFFHPKKLSGTLGALDASTPRRLDAGPCGSRGLDRRRVRRVVECKPTNMCKIKDQILRYTHDIGYYSDPN